MDHNQSEPYLIKQISKLFTRIERIVVPVSLLKLSFKLANLILIIVLFVY